MYGVRRLDAALVRRSKNRIAESAFPVSLRAGNHWLFVGTELREKAASSRRIPK